MLSDGVCNVVGGEASRGSDLILGRSWPGPWKVMRRREGDMLWYRVDGFGS